MTNLIYLAEQTADPETKLTLGLAQQELQRVSHITTNTLQLNRQRLLPTAMDVAGAMQSVIDLYQGRFKQAGVQVVLEADPCPPFKALEGEIRQVFANLVGNALDTGWS